MASIDTVKDLLNNRFSDGRVKLPSKANPKKDYPLKGILLFYSNDDIDNSIIALGKKTQIGLYSQGVQIAILHTDYNKSRDIAFQVLEYLNANMPTGIVLRPQSSPTYAGIQDQRGQHIFIIEYLMKGDK
jgi:hypothetical protein